MKRKSTYKIILLTIFISCFLLNITQAIAQPGEFMKEEDIPKTVLDKLVLLYPTEDRTKLVWELEGGSYEAYVKNERGSTRGVLLFSVEGKLSYRIFTDSEGLRTGTEREISLDALPESILELHKKHVMVVATQQLDNREGTTGYRVITDDGQRYNYDDSHSIIK